MKTYADRHDDDRRKRKRPNRMMRERFEDLDEEEVMEMIDSPHENLMLMMEQFTSPEPREADESHLIGDDHTAEAEGKISKSAFLEMLEAEVRANLAESFEGTGFSEKDCPWLKHLFRHYKHRGAAHLEKSIHKYLPETRNAESVEEYIAPLQAKVQRAIAAWLKSGEITEVPDEIPRSLLQMAGQGAANQRAKMGKGKELESGTKSKMEGAFGANLSDVKVHTDSEGSAFAQGLDAQAATIGKDIAFASDKYKPGTPEGDALIAHELAHVMQQSDAMENGEMGSGADYGAMEEDAEGATMGVMGKLFGKAKGIFGDLRMNGMVRLKSGLQVQRCNRGKREPDIAPLMPDETTLSGMSYSDLEAKALEFDAYILENYDALTVEEINDNIDHIKHIEDLQFVLVKTGVSSDRQSNILLGDLWSEMVGRKFITRVSVGNIPEKTEVTILYWSRMESYAIIEAVVNKVDEVEKIEKEELDVYDDKKFRKDSGMIYYNVVNSEGRSSKNLVRETMYNRFDPQIYNWVNYYNKELKPTTDADPNVLKSMLFQESKVGTYGIYLKLPPYGGPISGTADKSKTNQRMSKFNLGQAIDSSAYQQYLMVKELAPDIFLDKKLDLLSTEYLTAKHKKKEIERTGSTVVTLTKSEEKLLADTKEISANAGNEYFYDMGQEDLFAWRENATEIGVEKGRLVEAIEEFNSKRDGTGQNLNAQTGGQASDQDLFLDYDFWIRTAARWWFQKYDESKMFVDGGSWELATRLYNGDNWAARIYQKEVYDRVSNTVLNPELQSKAFNVDDQEIAATYKKYLNEEYKNAVDKITSLDAEIALLPAGPEKDKKVNERNARLNDRARIFKRYEEVDKDYGKLKKEQRDLIDEIATLPDGPVKDAKNLTLTDLNSKITVMEDDFYNNKR